MSILSSAALVVPLYLLVGFSASVGNALRFFATIALLTGIGTMMGFATGCVSKDLNEAQTKIMPLITPQLVFCGFLLPEKRIPVYLRWLYHTSSWQYCISILQINEFEGKVYTEDCPSLLPLSPGMLPAGPMCHRHRLPRRERSISGQVWRALGLLCLPLSLHGWVHVHRVPGDPARVPAVLARAPSGLPRRS